MFDFAEHRKRSLADLAKHEKNKEKYPLIANTLFSQENVQEFLKTYIVPYFFEAISEEPIEFKWHLTLEPNAKNSPYYWHIYFERGFIDEIIRIPKRYTTYDNLIRAVNAWIKDSENTYAYITWSDPEHPVGDILKIDFTVEIFS